MMRKDEKFSLILVHDKATSPSQLSLMRFLRCMPYTREKKEKNTGRKKNNKSLCIFPFH